MNTYLHIPRVVELLKQLFWKQNRYAVNNNQYAQENSEARDGSQEKTTPIPQSTHANKTSPPRISRHMKAPKGTRFVELLAKERLC
jgi:hypothetical protein